MRYDESYRTRVAELHSSGMSKAAISRDVGVSFPTISKWLDPEYAKRQAECVKSWKKENHELVAEWSRRERRRRPEVARAATKKYADEHPEKAKERSRAYYLRNRDDVNERAAKWRKEHPEEYRLISKRMQSKRRAWILGGGGEFTSAEFIQLCDEWGWTCAYCGRELTNKTVTVDHKIPLSRGGRNDIQNIAPACLSCNSSKHAKTPEEFASVLAMG